ncbi:MAG: AarF/ABC1/UbiB kinase family protein [Bacteroidetes bacterium]|nr:MAG: AarF/ABC1/UbiB kinase family protein [Bacteroidota bacterium]
MAEEQSKIPSSKIQRASRFMRTGVKVGGNYLKHYSKQLLGAETSREALDEKNAADIYDTLSQLKGSALKVAQMLSMDRGMLPEAFSKQFAQAQHKAPPLSGPLIVKTFRQYFGKSPGELYDRFEMQSTHAASIGQVHRAEKDGAPLAVKIQYPGVADSVVSDLRIVRPFARQLFGWKDADLDVYFEEVQDRLLEETDYALELERGRYLSEQCREIPHLVFPVYYPELSAPKVVSMSWLEGMHMDAFLATEPSQEIRNQAGQALWDFYNYQVHRLKLMHADAHPGNFLFRPDGTVGVLDFGCVKEIPEAFYQTYFSLLQPSVLEDEATFLESCRAAQIIHEEDTAEEIALYTGIFREALDIVLAPFHQGRFDFGDDAYFDRIYAYGDQMGRNPALRRTKSPRGDKDGLYLNRTYFGLFSILHKLRAEVDTQHYMPELV